MGRRPISHQAIGQAEFCKTLRSIFFSKIFFSCIKTRVNIQHAIGGDQQKKYFVVSMRKASCSYRSVTGSSNSYWEYTANKHEKIIQTNPESLSSHSLKRKQIVEYPVGIDHLLKRMDTADLNCNNLFHVWLVDRMVRKVGSALSVTDKCELEVWMKRLVHEHLCHAFTAVWSMRSCYWLISTKYHSLDLAELWLPPCWLAICMEIFKSLISLTVKRECTCFSGKYTVKNTNSIVFLSTEGSWWQSGKRCLKWTKYG